MSYDPIQLDADRAAMHRHLREAEQAIAEAHAIKSRINAHLEELIEDNHGSPPNGTTCSSCSTARRSGSRRRRTHRVRRYLGLLITRQDRQITYPVAAPWRKASGPPGGHP